jgi:hypothetical protein
MDSSKNGESRKPDFVAKVDVHLEIRDACLPKEEMAAFIAAHPRRTPAREPLPDGRIPDLVFLVDEYVEFVDMPVPATTIRPSPTNAAPTPAPIVPVPPQEPDTLRK